MSYPREKRLAEEIKKIVSSIIRNELGDPRVSPMTSIVEVDLTKDQGRQYLCQLLGDDNEKRNYQRSNKG